MSKNNRKTLLINKNFQLDFLKKTYLFQLLIMGIFFIIFFWLYYPLFKEITALNLNLDHPLMETLDNFHFMLVTATILGFILFTSLFTMAGLLLSHKIAGPLFNLKRHFKSMREEHHFNKIIFRKNDYFHDLEEEVNEFFDYFESRSGHKHDPKN